MTCGKKNVKTPTGSAIDSASPRRARRCAAPSPVAPAGGAADQRGEGRADAEHDRDHQELDARRDTIGANRGEPVR